MEDGGRGKSVGCHALLALEDHGERHAGRAVVGHHAPRTLEAKKSLIFFPYKLRHGSKVLHSEVLLTSSFIK